MASRPIIICPQCRSYKTAKVESKTAKVECESWRARVREWFRISAVPPDRQAGSYVCGSCAFKFDVPRPEEHCRAHPPDIHRCMSCDRTAVELVEPNHRRDGLQPPEEILDLYRCTHCGTTVLLIVQEDPSTLYG